MAQSVKARLFPGVFFELTQEIYPAVTDDDTDYLSLITIYVHSIYNVHLVREYFDCLDHRHIHCKQLGSHER
jgi:hypothetical protein